MKRKCTTLVYILADAVFAVLMLYTALLLGFNFSIPERISADMVIYYPVIISAFIFFSYILGCYDEIVQYTGISELLKQLIAVSVTAVSINLLRIIGMVNIPVSVILIMACLLFMATGGIRTLPRIAARFKCITGNKSRVKRTIIIGAGACGAMIIKRLKDNNIDSLYPVACIDDDSAKKDMRICGVRVYGTTDEIGKVARKCRADEIMIAIPSAGAKTIRNIYEKCSDTGLPVKLFQNAVDIEEFIQGKRSALKKISLEDLLCREMVQADSGVARAYIKGKTVLVTGGAGSIGSELCRQALKNGCRKLIIFDIHENGLFNINEELKGSYLGQYELVLGSVREKNHLFNAFEEYRPQIVFHAAAHKHVPLSEINPFEAAKNNIIGTKNVIDACKKYTASKLILISTDKAVNPTNVMGATKRIAEMMIQCNSSAETEMVSVRFGNVLGSSGSVVPIFEKQIALGGPVTITHPEMKRYFMTIPEAVSLVQTAAALASGGEIFVLDMGEPVKILDLAKDLIRLFGLEPYRDIEIKITGLRPGEKLFEELSLDSEEISRTSHSKIFVVRSSMFDQLRMRRDLAAIMECIEEGKDTEKIRDLLFEAIKERPLSKAASED
ncbi:MAG: nucleoside-diphosphate sugar epimerase/dehydratase [Bacillota bacterium]|nr:nucleoside-diphosphate sugar epimerase/dehydratase [Bacillota bacterium]